MPVTVAKILKLVPRIRLGRIIATADSLGRRVRGHDGCARVEKQSDMALQVDRITEIAAGRKSNDASAGGRGSIDGLVDRRRVQALAIAGSSEGSYVESIAVAVDLVFAGAA